MKRITTLLLALCLALFVASCQGAKDTADKAEAPAATKQAEKAETSEAASEKAAPADEETEESGESEETADSHLEYADPGEEQGFDSAEAVGQAFCVGMVNHDIEVLLSTSHPVQIQMVLDMVKEMEGVEDAMAFIKEEFAKEQDLAAIDSCTVENADDYECEEQDVQYFESEGLVLKACADVTMRMVGTVDGEEMDEPNKEVAGLVDGRWYMIMN